MSVAKRDALEIILPPLARIDVVAPGAMSSLHSLFYLAHAYIGALLEQNGSNDQCKSNPSVRPK
jgi:hypothetical protein